jgi:hypothetical protein
MLMSMADRVEDEFARADPSHNLDAEVIWSGMGPSAEMEAVGIQSVLTAAGIDAIINGFSQIPSVPFEVLVAREQADQARQVLAEAVAAGSDAAEEGERQNEAASGPDPS